MIAATTILGQSEPVSDDNEEILQTPLVSRNEHLPSYPHYCHTQTNLFLGEYYPTAGVTVSVF